MAPRGLVFNKRPDHSGLADGTVAEGRRRGGGGAGKVSLFEKNIKKLKQEGPSLGGGNERSRRSLYSGPNVEP